ncbi:MAG: XRE family transcriptional regulator [Chloroflexota bacterium]|nr:MAG: XRE family transcriptional regulator [Chloroflexota bacterium]
MLTREELGRRIARERQRAGLTQEQLASALGLERTAITRIEQGRQGVDTLQLSAIAQAVGRPPVIFFESDEERSLEVILRAPDARREDVRQQLEWLTEFIRDYEFLLDLTSGVQAK